MGCGKFCLALVAFILVGCTEATTTSAAANPSCVGTASSTASVYGSWVSEQSDSLGNTQSTSINIQAGLLTATTDCQFTTGLNLTTQTISAPFQAVSADAFYVPNTNTYTTPPTPDPTGVARVCAVTIPQGTYTYAFVGNCLSLTSAATGTIYYVP